MVKTINDLLTKDFALPSTIMHQAKFGYLQDRNIKFELHKTYLEGIIKWESMKGEIKF